MSERPYNKLQCVRFHQHSCHTASAKSNRIQPIKLAEIHLTSLVLLLDLHTGQPVAVGLLKHAGIASSSFAALLLAVQTDGTAHATHPKTSRHSTQPRLQTLRSSCRPHRYGQGAWR